MNNEILLQYRELISALALGMTAGLVYDILSPLRIRAGRGTAIAMDMFYSAAVTAGLFLNAMSSPSGRLGGWSLSSALLGFLVYTWILSDMIYPLWDKITASAVKETIKFKNFLKNVLCSVKNVFKKPQ